MFKNLPDVLTVRQVMRALSVGKNTVYKLLKSKELRSIKIGKKYMVPKIFLIDFVKAYR